MKVFRSCRVAVAKRRAIDPREKDSPNAKPTLGLGPNKMMKNPSSTPMNPREDQSGTIAPGGG